MRLLVWVLQRCHTSKADVRSVGVICYALLTGTMHPDENVRAPSTRILQGRPWTSALRCISHNATAFMKLLKSVDTSIRPNAVVPLQHMAGQSFCKARAFKPLVSYTRYLAVVFSSQCHWLVWRLSEIPDRHPLCFRLLACCHHTTPSRDRLRDHELSSERIASDVRVMC